MARGSLNEPRHSFRIMTKDHDTPIMCDTRKGYTSICVTDEQLHQCKIMTHPTNAQFHRRAASPTIKLGTVWRMAYNTPRSVHVQFNTPCVSCGSWLTTSGATVADHATSTQGHLKQRHASSKESAEPTRPSQSRQTKPGNGK